MKLRHMTIALTLLFATPFGMVVAQHDHGTPGADHHDHGTPHADHDQHGHAHDMEAVSMGAFYFTVTNNGEETDRLVMVETDMADVVEIHDMDVVDGVMQMQPMHDGVDIEPGESIVLEPGSYHIMMIGLTESLINGEEFTATLHFENAGEVEITVPIHINEPDEGEFGEPVDVGDDIEISNVWARHAPKLEGMATPMATPDATPDN